MTSVGLDCTPGFAGKKHNSEEPKGLVDYSPKDKPWDVHRAQAEVVERLLLDALEGGCQTLRLNHGLARLRLKNPSPPKP